MSARAVPELALGLLGGAWLTIGLLTWLLELPWWAGAAAAAVVALGVWWAGRGRAATAEPAPETTLRDRHGWRALSDLASAEGLCLAVTGSDGTLRFASEAYRERFGDLAPRSLAPGDAGAGEVLARLETLAWRDLRAQAPVTLSDSHAVTVTASDGDQLLWRFAPLDTDTGAMGMAEAIDGDLGRRWGEAGLMLTMLSPDGRVRAASPTFAARAGRGRDAIIGEDVAQLLALNVDGLVHFRAEEPDAPPLRLMQIPSGPGEVDFVVALIDETMRPLGQADTQSLHSLLSMLPIGLALADRDGRLLFFNRAFARAAHVDDKAPPTYPGDLVIGEDKAAVADAIRRFANGHQVSGNIDIRLAAAPEESTALTLAGTRGLGDAAVLLSLRDNTEEVRLKRQVAQATKMQAVGQLAGGLAHDFNNIITAILGNCDLMLMRHIPGDSDYDDILQVRLNANKAAGLTRQLLAFSRQQTLRPQVFQLPDVVSEVAHMLQRILGERITLTTSHGRGLGNVRADPGQIEQVIINLAINARDAMPDGGTLTIETFATPAHRLPAPGRDIMPHTDYVGLAVTDTGTGIPDDYIGKVFEPFFTTKEVGKGTGLGLSMVYGIIKQSGGFIFVDSTVGKGTRFSIYLPTHYGPVAEAEPPAAAPRNAPWGEATILLVEDEDMVRTVAERALSRHGYRITATANGEEALEAFAGMEQCDLLLTDVVMPVMDGPALARKLREQRPDLPIVFMSGYAEEQLRRSIDMDVVGFLPKPFSVQQLAEAIANALEKSS